MYICKTNPHYMKPQKHVPSKMQLSDLKEVAKYLPDTGQDHEYNILEAYGEGTWHSVNEYIQTVIIRSKLQPRTASLLIKGHKLLTRVNKCLKRLNLDIR